MDGTGPREGVMKPVILRVAVALVVSATGLILAKFVSWKEDNELPSSASNPESSSSPSRRDDGKEEEETESVNHDDQKQEIYNLKSRFEELQRKEYEMELRFERYCKLKDQEAVLMEHKSRLGLEKSQLEFFRREYLAMEEEHKRGKDLVMVYLKLVGEIQELRSENGLLQGKAKMLRRRARQLYRVVYEKSRRISGVEKELLMCFDELEVKNNIVKQLEGEVKDLKANEEVSRKSSNSKSEMVSIEEYTRVLQENEELKKDFGNGVKEVINLRWRNACLRHEVMRKGSKYGEIVFSPNRNLQELGLEDDADALALTVADEHHEDALALTVADGHHEGNHHHHESSKRKRLLKKLKRWVEGNEKGKSTKTEERCFGRHSLTVEEGMFHSRRSCSSV